MQLDTATQTNTAIQTLTFNDTAIHLIPYEGGPCFLASEVGIALGYKDSFDLARKLNSDWQEEFLDSDVIKVTGQDLSDLKEAVAESLAEAMGESPIASEGNRKPSPINKFAPHTLLLTQSGVNLACMKAQTGHGVSFRRWLATEVLPAIQKTGSYSLKGAKVEVETEAPREVACAKDTAAATLILRATKMLWDQGLVGEDILGDQCARVIEMAGGKTMPDLREAIRETLLLKSILKAKAAAKALKPAPTAQTSLRFESANEDQEAIDLDPILAKPTPALMHVEESQGLDHYDDTQPAA